jgi:hypothetical protein
MSDHELPGVCAELADLREHWDSAYIITADREGLAWVAIRRDGLGTLTESTAQGLRAQIREDYDARPVVRRQG